MDNSEIFSKMVAILSFAVPVFVILFVIISIINYNKSKKDALDKIKSIKGNDIQVYIQMLLNNNELEKKRKKYQTSKKICLSIAVCAFIIIVINVLWKDNIFLYVLLVPVVVIAIIAIIIISNVSKDGYSKIYKSEVISSVIQKYDNSLIYQPENGLSATLYKTACFERFDRFHTEDLIVGQVCDLDFIIADVHTEREHTDSDGNTDYATLFRGPVGVVKLDKLNDIELDIVNNQIKVFGSYGYLEIDNSRFEGIYDVFTNNDVVAMRILTPTLTNKILELYKKFGFFFEIKLINGYVFFRFYCETLFNPCPSDIEQEALDIAYYFNMLDGIRDIMKEITKSLKKFER